MKPQLKNEKKNESGAIMLEIIAVLALMGVMGAMLFRQINQRNQELHNIQMASEIRLAKEAFSAWIQTNQATLTGSCLNDVERCSGEVVHCPKTRTPRDRRILASDVSNYLPDGYLVGANSLANNYNLYLFGYWVGQTGMCSPAFYGVIVPKNNVLPDGGESTASWNFKRAARVSMLIGGDGGAFDPDITGANNIVGSVGTWRLPTANTNAGGVPLLKDDTTADYNTARYVALTGLDVFQPEVEVPAGRINVPTDMSWAGRDMGAWNTFVVGGDIGPSGCFEINHATAESGNVNPDVIRAPGVSAAANCDPVFWVDATDVAKGTVYVRNGMEVGYNKDTNTSGVSFRAGSGKDSEVIVSDKAGKTSVIIAASENSGKPNRTVTIKDGKILMNSTTGKVSSDSGSVMGYQYQLDPANTSVMYDIRLGARGGLKLTDLLPKHILQDVGQISCTSAGTSINAPSCKSGYTKALVLLPQVTPTQNLVEIERGSKTQSEWDATPGALKVTGVSTVGGVDNVAIVNPPTKMTIKVPTITISGNIDRPNRVVSHGKDGNGSALTSINASSNKWTVACEDGTGVIGYQTYCMMGTLTNAVIKDDTGKDATALDRPTCLSMGMGWNDTTGCYPLSSSGTHCSNVTTGYGDITLGERCRRSGCIFVSSDGTDTNGKCKTSADEQ